MAAGENRAFLEETIGGAHQPSCWIATGALWQRDYFDRLLRNEKHFARCVRYIRNNAAKVHLRPGEYILYESDFAQAVGEAV